MTESKTLEIAVALIEEFEGIELESYLDPVGVPTICAGMTRYRDGSPVRMGDVCSIEVCRGHLELTLIRDFLPAMELIPGWKRFGARRQASLLSFAWNLGAKFYGSPGFEEITRVLRDGSKLPEIYQQMSEALQVHEVSAGHVFLGLRNRREKESSLWAQEDDGTIRFIAKKDTYLKKAAIDDTFLSDAGKLKCPRNEEIAITRLDEIPVSSHAWVRFKGSEEAWAIYLPDWLPECVQAANLPTDPVNWSDFSARAGEFITVGEVLQHDSRRAPEPGSWDETQILSLCKEFDEIRRAWGSPIGVSSGYRPEPINTDTGGSKNSYHVTGAALDIYPEEGQLDVFYNWLARRWSGGLGDGRSKGFIHIDMREGGMFNPRAGAKPVAMWEY